MNVVYVVQYSDSEHPFIDLIYCVTETEEDAIVLSEEIGAMDHVLEAGYEKVEYVTEEEMVVQDKNPTNK